MRAYARAKQLDQAVADALWSPFTQTSISARAYTSAMSSTKVEAMASAEAETSVPASSQMPQPLKASA